MSTAHLLDIAPTPREVIVPRDLPETLFARSRPSGGALALVSGRPLADIDEFFSPLRLALAIGGHGAEMRPVADGVSHRAAARRRLTRSSGKG